MLEVKKFPVHMADIPVDKSDMKKCLLTGLFEESADVNGVSRQFYTYLAPGLHYNQRCIVLAPFLAAVCRAAADIFVHP